MAEVLQQPFSLEGLSIHSGSISFGRFETEPLSWERRSAFSCNNYLEDVEKYSKPGSVNQRKAYFEVFFKRKGLLQPPDSLCQNWTDCQANEGELVDDSNYMELYKERLPECDEETSSNHSEHAVKEPGEFCQPQADHMSLQRKDKRQAYIKSKVEAETGRSHASNKRPESSSGLRKSRKVIMEGKAELKTASTKLQTTSSSNTVRKDSTHLQKQDLSISHTVKKPVQNISTAKTPLSKTPKLMEVREVEKQKQHASAKVKETGKIGSLLQTSNKRKDGSVTGQSASRPHKVARSSTEKATKSIVSTINSNLNGGISANKNEGKEARIKQMPESNNSKATRTPASNSMSVQQGSGGKKAVPEHAETTKSRRKSSDPANKVTAVKSIVSTSSSVRPLDPQLSKRSGTPSKDREKILPVTSSLGEKQVGSKKHDSSHSQTVSKPSKLSKLQSQSSSPSPLRRDLRESSASSSVKLLSSQRTNKTESPTTNHLPTKHLLRGKEFENRKRDPSPSQTVCKPSKLAKLQPKLSILRSAGRAPSESLTSSSIKKLSSQCMNRSELHMTKNLPTKCSTGGKEVAAKKRNLDASQTVTKSSKLEKLQSKSSSLSPVRRSPSESSSSSLKQLSSQRTKRTESPMKNDLLTKSLPRGKEVTAKKRGSDGSQTVSTRSKLEMLQPKISSPSPFRRAPAASSKSLSIEKISSKTNKSASSMKNNLPAKSQPGGKEDTDKKRDSDILFTVTDGMFLQHESSSPSSVLEVAAASSTSSSVGGFSPQPDKEIETPKNRNDTKKVGTNKNNATPLKRESILNKSTKSQSKPSASGNGPVGSTHRTSNSQYFGRVESVKAVKRSESPCRDPGTRTLKQAVPVSRKVAAGR